MQDKTIALYLIDISLTVTDLLNFLAYLCRNFLEVPHGKLKLQGTANKIGDNKLSKYGTLIPNLIFSLMESFLLSVIKKFFHL